MTQIKERIEGHYEVEEIPYGRVYKWTPGHALVACDCGQLLFVDPATTATCPECGADYAGAVEGLEGRPLVQDETYYSKHRAYEEWRREEKVHPEYDEYDHWLELQALE